MDDGQPRLERRLARCIAQEDAARPRPRSPGHAELKAYLEESLSDTRPMRYDPEELWEGEAEFCGR